MKLCLITSIFLLVSAVALARPRYKPPVKIIFDSGTVISESFDARKISHSYGSRPARLIFHSRHNQSDNDGAWMHIGGAEMKSVEDIKNANLSFVVEIRSLTPTKDETKELKERFCYQNSAASLQKLIVNCRDSMVLRELTDGEEDQIESVKGIFPGNRHGFFTMTFDHGKITSQSQFIDSFSVSLGYYSRTLGQFWVSSSDYPGGYRFMTFMNFDGVRNGSFLIESIPRARDLNCMDSPIANRIVECTGSIYLREYPVNSN